MDNVSSASTDPGALPVTVPARAGIGGATLLAYLAFCLAGLALGFWPGAVYASSRVDIPSAPLPALQCLCVAQAAFILLAHPILLARRGGRGCRITFCVAESLVCLAATGPFYFVVAWLGDATAIDVCRSVVNIAMLWPIAWAAGVCISRGLGGATLLTLLVICLGLPAGWYICTDFLPGLNAGWLWNLAPLANAWTQAASHGLACWPTPIWPALAWSALAAATGLVLLMVLKR